MMETTPVFKQGDRVRVTEAAKRETYFKSQWEREMRGLDINGTYTVHCMNSNRNCVHLAYVSPMCAYNINGAPASYGLFSTNYQLVHENLIPNELFEL